MPEANETMLHFMSVMAQHEAKAIRLRTKAALAAAKARGTKLGGYRWAILRTFESPRGRGFWHRRRWTILYKAACGVPPSEAPRWRATASRTTHAAAASRERESACVYRCADSTCPYNGAG
ncbi:MAG: recombinase family protein [Silvibacterium sp.]